jgi:hypothetical protein
VSSGGQWWARRCGRCCHTRHPQWPQRSVADFASYRAQRAAWHQAVIAHVGYGTLRPPPSQLWRSWSGGGVPEHAGGVDSERGRSSEHGGGVVLEWRRAGRGRAWRRVVLERRSVPGSPAVLFRSGAGSALLAALTPSAGRHRSLSEALPRSGGGPEACRRRLSGALGSPDLVVGVLYWAREWEGAWVGWAGWSRTLTDKAQRRACEVLAWIALHRRRDWS